MRDVGDWRGSEALARPFGTLGFSFNICSFLYVAFFATLVFVFGFLN